MAPRENLNEALRSLQIDRRETAPPPRFGRLLAIVAVVAVLLLTGAAVAWRVFLSGPLEVEVAYARVASGAGEARSTALSGSGYAITREKYIAIGVRVPGRIERYRVDEGDRVKAGQPLVELDDRDYRAQAGRAEASLRLARANRDLALRQVERVRKLFAEGVSSKDELDQAESRHEVAAAAVTQAENEVTQASVNLEDTVLRSPVDGVVLSKLKAVGEIAVPGGFSGAGDLLRVADLSELRAEVDVSESDLAHVRLGQDAEVTPDAYVDRRYAAKVVKLYPQVNRQKGTLKVEVAIAEPDEKLLPDMSVRVNFLAEAPPAPESGQARVLAPRSAVRGGDQSYVWVATAGKLRRQPVTTGGEVGQEVAIVQGLSGGEALVLGPEDELREGRAVAPRTKAP